MDELGRKARGRAGIIFFVCGLIIIMLMMIGSLHLILLFSTISLFSVIIGMILMSQADEK